MQPTRLLWFNGEMVPWESATVHVMAHGLHYGSSVFEGIRAYDTPRGPMGFRLTEHVQRLYDSARIYRMEVPYELCVLVDACRRVVRDNGLRAAYIRPIVYRGFGDLGVASVKSPIQVAIASFQWGEYLGEGAVENGVEAGVSSWNRIAPNTMPVAAKAGGNYLSSQLVAMEAKRHGYQEGIALDHQNMVAEGSGENIFLVRRGVIYTTPLWGSILPGFTRDAVIQLARDRGLEVREEPIPREQLYLAEEIFFTGTAAEVTPIRAIDGLQVGEGRRGPVTRQIQEAFFGLFDGTTPDEHGWLEPIEDQAELRRGA